MDASIPTASNGARRILVINPNTNPAVTERVRIVGESVVSPGTEIHAVNPEQGPFGIESAEDRAEAEPQVISMIREGSKKGFDAFVLACFDDIGLGVARGLVRGPVVGSCEAGIGVAQTLARRFSVITTFANAVPTIRGLMRRYGVMDITTVRAAGISVAEAAANGDGDNRDLLDAVRNAMEIDKAEAILLGSGGLTGRARSLSRQFGIPVIDGTAAAIKLAESALVLDPDSHGSPR
jgi:allantoin racemase